MQYKINYKLQKMYKNIWDRSVVFVVLILSMKPCPYICNTNMTTNIVHTNTSTWQILKGIIK